MQRLGTHPSDFNDENIPPIARRRTRAPTSPIIISSDDETNPPTRRGIPSAANSGRRPLRVITRPPLHTRPRPFLRNTHAQQHVPAPTSAIGGSAAGLSNSAPSRTIFAPATPLGRTTIHQMVHSFVIDLGSTLRCSICKLTFNGPVVLACGHSFCAACIRRWFDQSLRAHVHQHPDYTVQPRDIIADIALIREFEDDDETRLWRADVIRRIEEIAHPMYTCPECRASVTRPPAPNFTLHHTITVAIAAGVHIPDDRIDSLAAITWDDLFLAI